MVTPSADERWKQLKEENERRRRKFEELEHAKKQAAELNAKEALQRRRQERLTEDQRMRQPWQQPEQPKKPILKAGQHKPKVTQAVRDASPGADGRCHDAARVRREWRDGLRAHIEQCRAAQTTSDTPTAASPTQTGGAGAGAAPSAALTWAELKLAAQEGFEELLRQQQLQQFMMGDGAGERRLRNKSPYRPGAKQASGPEPMQVKLLPSIQPQASEMGQQHCMQQEKQGAQQQVAGHHVDEATAQTSDLQNEHDQQLPSASSHSYKPLVLQPIEQRTSVGCDKQDACLSSNQAQVKPDTQGDASAAAPTPPLQASQSPPAASVTQPFMRRDITAAVRYRPSPNTLASSLDASEEEASACSHDVAGIATPVISRPHVTDSLDQYNPVDLTPSEHTASMGSPSPGLCDPLDQCNALDLADQAGDDMDHARSVTAGSSTPPALAATAGSTAALAASPPSVSSQQQPNSSARVQGAEGTDLQAAPSRCIGVMPAPLLIGDDVASPLSTTTASVSAPTATAEVGDANRGPQGTAATAHTPLNWRPAYEANMEAVKSQLDPLTPCEVDGHTVILPSLSSPRSRGTTPRVVSSPRQQLSRLLQAEPSSGLSSPTGLMLSSIALRSMGSPHGMDLISPPSKPTNKPVGQESVTAAVVPLAPEHRMNEVASMQLMDSPTGSASQLGTEDTTPAEPAAHQLPQQVSQEVADWHLPQQQVTQQVAQSVQKEPSQQPLKHEAVAHSTALLGAGQGMVAPKPVATTTEQSLNMMPATAASRTTAVASVHVAPSPTSSTMAAAATAPTQTLLAPALPPAAAATLPQTPVVPLSAAAAAAVDSCKPPGEDNFDALLSEIQHLSILRKALRAEFEALGEPQVAAGLTSLTHAWDKASVEQAEGKQPQQAEFQMAVQHMHSRQQGVQQHQLMHPMQGIQPQQPVPNVQQAAQQANSHTAGSLVLEAVRSDSSLLPASSPAEADAGQHAVTATAAAEQGPGVSVVQSASWAGQHGNSPCIVAGGVPVLREHCNPLFGLDDSLGSSVKPKGCYQPLLLVQQLAAQGKVAQPYAPPQQAQPQQAPQHTVPQQSTVSQQAQQQQAHVQHLAPQQLAPQHLAPQQQAHVQHLAPQQLAPQHLAPQQQAHVQQPLPSQVALPQQTPYQQAQLQQEPQQAQPQPPAQQQRPQQHPTPLQTAGGPHTGGLQGVQCVQHVQHEQQGLVQQHPSQALQSQKRPQVQQQQQHIPLQGEQPHHLQQQLPVPAAHEVQQPDVQVQLPSKHMQDAALHASPVVAVQSEPLLSQPQAVAQAAPSYHTAETGNAFQQVVLQAHLQAAGHGEQQDRLQQQPLKWVIPVEPAKSPAMHASPALPAGTLQQQQQSTVNAQPPTQQQQHHSSGCNADAPVPTQQQQQRQGYGVKLVANQQRSRSSPRPRLQHDSQTTTAVPAPPPPPERPLILEGSYLQAVTQAKARAEQELQQRQALATQLAAQKRAAAAAAAAQAAATKQQEQEQQQRQLEWQRQVEQQKQQEQQRQAALLAARQANASQGHISPPEACKTAVSASSVRHPSPVPLRAPTSIGSYAQPPPPAHVANAQRAAKAAAVSAAAAARVQQQGASLGGSSFVSSAPVSSAATPSYMATQGLPLSAPHTPGLAAGSTALSQQPATSGMPGQQQRQQQQAPLTGSGALPGRSATPSRIPTSPATAASRHHSSTPTQVAPEPQREQVMELDAVLAGMQEVDGTMQDLDEFLERAPSDSDSPDRPVGLQHSRKLQDLRPGQLQLPSSGWSTPRSIGPSQANIQTAPHTGASNAKGSSAAVSKTHNNGAQQQAEQVLGQQRVLSKQTSAQGSVVPSAVAPARAGVLSAGSTPSKYASPARPRGQYSGTHAPSKPVTPFTAAIRDLMGLPGAAPLAAATPSPAATRPCTQTQQQQVGNLSGRPGVSAIDVAAAALSQEEALLLASLQRLDKGMLQRGIAQAPPGGANGQVQAGSKPTASHQGKQSGRKAGKVVAGRQVDALSSSHQALLLRDSLERLDVRLLQLKAQVSGRAAAVTGAAIPTAHAPVTVPSHAGSTASRTTQANTSPEQFPCKTNKTPTPNKAKALRDARQAQILAAMQAGSGPMQAQQGPSAVGPVGGAVLGPGRGVAAPRQASAGAGMAGTGSGASHNSMLPPLPRQASAPTHPQRHQHTQPSAFGYNCGQQVQQPQQQQQQLSHTKQAWGDTSVAQGTAAWSDGSQTSGLEATFSSPQPQQQHTGPQQSAAERAQHAQHAWLVPQASQQLPSLYTFQNPQQQQQQQQQPVQYTPQQQQQYPDMFHGQQQQPRGASAPAGMAQPGFSFAVQQPAWSETGQPSHPPPAWSHAGQQPHTSEYPHTQGPVHNQPQGTSGWAHQVPGYGIAQSASGPYVHPNVLSSHASSPVGGQPMLHYHSTVMKKRSSSGTGEQLRLSGRSSSSSRLQYPIPQGPVGPASVVNTQYNSYGELQGPPVYQHSNPAPTPWGLRDHVATGLPTHAWQACGTPQQPSAGLLQPPPGHPTAWGTAPLHQGGVGPQAGKPATVTGLYMQQGTHSAMAAPSMQQGMVPHAAYSQQSAGQWLAQSNSNPAPHDVNMTQTPQHYQQAQHNLNTGQPGLGAQHQQQQQQQQQMWQPKLQGRAGGQLQPASYEAPQVLKGKQLTATSAADGSMNAGVIKSYNLGVLLG